MEKQLAKKLMPLATQPDLYPLLQAYVEDRIETMRGYLETTRDHVKLLEIQGAIAELRRFQTLREQVIEGAK